MRSRRSRGRNDGGAAACPLAVSFRLARAGTSAAAPAAYSQERGTGGACIAAGRPSLRMQEETNMRKRT